MADREQFEAHIKTAAWYRVLSEAAKEDDESASVFRMARMAASEAWQASRRAAMEEAHRICVEGVKWSPEPSKQIQFYVNGTCHRLAADISQLAEGGKHE